MRISNIKPTSLLLFQTSFEILFVTVINSYGKRKRQHMGQMSLSISMFPCSYSISVSQVIMSPSKGEGGGDILVSVRIPGVGVTVWYLP